ncbi:MAG: YihY/virulence factor BrkB family protein [Clostridia bacterium]|nr:YihY/virulence factor BrkB family protein [Clostridia bacterium]
MGTRQGLGHDGESSFRFLKGVFSAQIFEGAAALSYYLLFSVFPFLIFLSAAFASLDLDPLESARLLQSVMPEKAVRLLTGYLESISGGTFPLMLFGGALTVFSMGKAVEVLKRKIRRAYGSAPETHAFIEWMVSLLFVLLLLVAVYGTLFLIVAGDRVFTRLLDAGAMTHGLWSLLHRGRILLAGAFLLFVVFGLYYVLPAVEQKPGEALPGAVFAVSIWIVVALLFSTYVDRFDGYSALYGPLGGIIVLLTWLFLLNAILLLGAQVNAHFYRRNREVRL